MTSLSHIKLGKFSIWLSCGVFALSILLFWFGLSFLKTEVFPHYYNTQKHVIVNQNPDTKEIYAWKDANNNVYTPEDAQVKNFTWGTTALLLFVMILGATIYTLGIKLYTKMLTERDSKTIQSYVPRLQ